VSALADLSDADRLKALQYVHPLYLQNRESWATLIDAFEGQGGFLNGGYLWPYPRESEVDFKHRQSMARYHNYLETMVDLYVRFIFTSGVRRESKSDAYNDWQTDVDGAGTEINNLLKRLAALALVAGHAGLLMDKTATPPRGPRQIDEKSRVVATVFAAPAIGDWRYAQNKLTGVKLFEHAPVPSIVDPLPVGDDARQYLLWDETGWARYDFRGVLVGSDTPKLGLVPLSVLRPKASQLGPLLGRPLAGNSNVIRALYNRASEEDEVLRAQAFSVLTVNVPPEGNVDEVRSSLGGVIGTSKALIVKGDIEYKTPSQEVAPVIRENFAFLVQELFRAAHVRHKRDSLAAESGESIRLQYTELNEMLQGFAKALAQLEQEMARAFFAWTTPDPRAADAAFDKAKVIAQYPTEFFLDPLIADLEAWVQALGMGLGPTMNKRVKKQAVRRIDPEIPPEDLKKIDKEIEAQPDEESGMPMPMLAPPDTGDPEGDAIKKAQEGKDVAA
jgi:hypothetical protein